jgi:hypothetical protein
MTIAAGFHVQEAILLCTDSMYTGQAKVTKPKIFAHIIAGESSALDVSIAIALAGHENYARMAIDECIEAIKDCPPDLRSLTNIRGVLKKAIKAFYGEYVDSISDPYERDRARFELIIGAWLPRGGGLKMFRSDGPAVIRVDDYHCSGSGAYLGDFFMKNLAHRQMSLREAALLAIQGIAAAKSYDANCGGSTQFVCIKNGGQLSNFVPYNTHDAERYVADFENQARSLLLQLGDTESSEEHFQERLDYFVGKVKEIRRYWKSGADPEYQRFMDLINASGFRREGPGV